MLLLLLTMLSKLPRSRRVAAGKRDRSQSLSPLSCPLPLLPSRGCRKSFAKGPRPGAADRPRGSDPAPAVFGRPESRKAAGPGGGLHFVTSELRPLRPRSST